MDVTHFRTVTELRKWFKKHHACATELWIGFHRKEANLRGVTYIEAIEVALCFGWIDGVRRSVDDRSYTNRFSPRKPRSYWSQINIQRYKQLDAEGLVEPAGRAAFDRRDEPEAGRYSFENNPSELAPEDEKLLRRNRAAWKFFESQAPYYRRLAAHWIRSAKRVETRARRLATLIEDSAACRRLKIAGGQAPAMKASSASKRKRGGKERSTASRSISHRPADILRAQ